METAHSGLRDGNQAVLDAVGLTKRMLAAGHMRGELSKIARDFEELPDPGSVAFAMSGLMIGLCELVSLYAPGWDAQAHFARVAMRVKARSQEQEQER